MDGRKLFILGAFALGACTGCVPTGQKELEARTPPPSAEATIASAPAASFFGEKKKTANLEIAWAMSLELNARRADARSEKQVKDFDEARKAYHEILNYVPDSIEAMRGLGRVYVGLGDFERAAATFKRAIEKHPNNAPVYAEYSIVFSKRNQFPDAIRLVSKAVELDPENQEYQRMLAVDLVCNGQIEQGLAAMTRARGPAAAHYYIARVYERKGRPDLTRAELAKALQTNPNLQEARTMLESLRNPQPAAASAAPGTTPARVPASGPATLPTPAQAELSFTSFEGR